MPVRRYLPTILIVLLLATLLFFSFRASPILVDGEQVSQGPMAMTIEEEGRTRVVNRYVLYAPMLSQIRRIELQAGDRVEKGEVVAVLDALAVPPLDARAMAEAGSRVAGGRAAMAAAEREKEAAAALARLAEAELRRLRQLAAENLIAPRDLDAAEAEARRATALERSATFRVQTARHEMEAAQTALRYVGAQDPAASGRVELRAPVAGEVLRRFFESSRVVQAGEAILEIGDSTELEVEVDVLSADAVRIEPGMRVLFERWGGGESLAGEVRRIEPGGFTKVSALGVEEQRVLVIVDFISPRQEWARLGDAYRVNASFVLWEAPDAVRVPSSALFRREEGWAVFIVANGRARLRPVEIGERGGRFTRLVSGLEKGETVIVHPPREVAEGTRLRLRQGG